MLSSVPSAVCLTPAKRMETPLSVATPLRRLTRQPSSFAPLVKAVPSAPTSYSSTTAKVSNCIASVVASPPVATDLLSTAVSSTAVSSTAVSSTLPSTCLRSSSTSSFTSASVCTSRIETRRMTTSDSSSCLDTRGRRSNSCVASVATSSSEIMKRTASPVRPRTATSSPLMHSRVSLHGAVKVNSWGSANSARACNSSRASVFGQSGSAQNLCGSLLAASGTASVAVPVGSCSISVPSGSASVAVPSGSASVSVPRGSSVSVPRGSARASSGSASVALPLGNCLRASLRASGSAARLPSVDRLLSMPQEDFGGSLAIALPQENFGGSLAVEDLHYETPEFDPSSPKCHRQLEVFLGLSRQARIEPLVGQAGGLNKGLWAVTGSSPALILKLVNSQRSHPCLPTETENLVKLAREYPNLLNDRDLSFPLKIFHCRRFGGNPTHDLIVMRRAPGESFADTVSRKWKYGRVSELMSHFEGAGCFLASVHNRYGLQHCDFQPSNLFYDEATNQFTMIDIADMSPKTFVVTENDFDHFCKGVRLLASILGEQLHIDGLRHFQAGYSKTRH